MQAIRRRFVALGMARNRRLEIRKTLVRFDRAIRMLSWNRNV